MKFLVTIFTIMIVVHADRDEEKFQNFKIKHGKNYRNQVEEVKRFGIFKSNLRFIEKHNAEEENGLHTYRLGTNQFADMSNEEFQDWLKVINGNKTRHETKSLRSKARALTDEVTKWDWRDHNAVNKVKNQEQCGSCWAFSSIGAVESAHQIKTGDMVSLSEQQLVDCDKQSWGCDGGYMTYAFESMKEKCCMKETSYPYKAVNGTCQWDSSKCAVYVESYYSLPQYEKELETAVLVQPISTAIHATMYFQFYKSGVFIDLTCQSSDNFLNHAVLTFGYGEENFLKYWLVKNSWGTSWGENGYAKMLKDQWNQCGIATMASYPVV